MTNKIKALCLAFVAITAMSAVAASAAQAGTLHIGANPAVLTGHSDLKVPPPGFQQDILSIGAGFNAICDTASFEGTVHQEVGGKTPATQTIHELTITPTYEKCKLAGTAATVQTHGCYYTLTGAGEPANTAKVDIICPTAKPITIKTALCTVDVPAQNGLSHIVFKNEINNHVTAEATVTGITAIQTGAACPGGNNKETKEASFSGNATVTAFKDAGNVLKTKTEHQANEYKHEGAGVELIST